MLGNRDMEAETRVTQIWLAVKGRGKKEGLSLSQSTFFALHAAACFSAKVHMSVALSVGTGFQRYRVHGVHGVSDLCRENISREGTRNSPKQRPRSKDPRE